MSSCVFLSLIFSSVGNREVGEGKKRGGGGKKNKTIILFLKASFSIDRHKVLYDECWRKPPVSQSWHVEGQVTRTGRLQGGRLRGYMLGLM